jgi:uncharacterized protein involved in exopolysaccharide biosynthesis
MKPIPSGAAPDRWPVVGSESERAAPPPGGFDPAPAPGLDAAAIREYVGVLRRHILLVIACAAAGLALAGYLAYRHQPQYRAAAVIRYVNERAALTGGIEAEQMEKITGPSTDPLLSQIQVLRSRAVAGVVVDATGLRLKVDPVKLAGDVLNGVSVAQNLGPDTLSLRFTARGTEVEAGGRRAFAPYGQPVSIQGVRFTVPARPHEEAATVTVLPRGRAVDALLADLRARPREKTDVIDVDYTSGDPRMAQRVVNSVVQTFRDYNARMAQQQSRRRREFIEAQLVTADNTLEQTQLALSSFRSRAQVYSSRDKIAAQQSGLMTLETRREELDADRRIAHNLLAGLRGAVGARADERLHALVSSPAVASDPVVMQLFTQLMQYQNARDTLTQGEWGSAATNPDVARLDGLIASTRGKLVSAVQGQITSLDARIASLDALRARGGAEIQELPSMEAEEVRLVQKVDAATSCKRRGSRRRWRGGRWKWWTWRTVPLFPSGAGGCERWCSGCWRG